MSRARLLLVSQSLSRRGAFPNTLPNVTYAYDSLGRLTSASQTGNGASQSFGHDALSRLSSVGNALTDTNQLSGTFSYNPASQIKHTITPATCTRPPGHGNGSTAYIQNGLTEQATIGGARSTWRLGGTLASRAAIS